MSKFYWKEQNNKKKLSVKSKYFFLQDDLYQKEDGEVVTPENFDLMLAGHKSLERQIEGMEHPFPSESLQVSRRDYDKFLQELNDLESTDLEKKIQDMRRYFISRPAPTPLPFDTTMIDEMVEGDEVMRSAVDMFKKSYSKLQQAYDTHIMVMEQVIHALVVRKSFLTVLFSLSMKLIFMALI